MIQNQEFLNEINNPVRQILAKVELYNSSTLVNTFTQEDKLISFKIERTGEGKFFGYGICQKINIKLIDINKELDITTDNFFRVNFGYKYNSTVRYVNCGFPDFYVTEVHRDETTNQLSITAYDKLYWASNYTTSLLNKYVSTFTVKYLADAISSGYLDLSGEVVLVNGDIATDETFSRQYAYGGNSYNVSNFINIDGTETFRELLDDIAEATQTIYFIQNNTLCFSRLSDQSGKWAQVITKDKYFDFDVKSNRRLTAITSTNELGDAVTASTGLTGTTAYIKDNMLWDLQEDIADLVDAALNRVENFTMNQFDLKWRGNPLLTIGDRLKVEKKEENTLEIDIYYLNSTITYDGGLQEEISWEYSESDLETANNPTTLGDALKQTSAKVDKVKQEITLLVDSVGTLSNFVMSEDGITASVMEKVQKNYATKDEIPSLTSLENRVKAAESKLTADALNLTFGTYIDEEGIGKKVVTETGFTFDEEGLTVSKANSEMNTTITEDGMTVYRDDEAMLTANNQGVDAVNLKASTYLIIGKNSRFEDYGTKRTGCFWIGG